MYCWHVRYALTPQGLGAFRAWLDEHFAPLLRQQAGLRGALLMRGERSDQLVLDTWWESRAAVERFLAAPECERERRHLDALGVLAASVDTASHDPVCGPSGRTRRAGAATARRRQPRSR